MDRLDFLKSLGLTAAALVVVGDLSSCKKNAKVDLSVDMGTSQYSSLLNPNSAVVVQNVIVAHTPTGGYVAVDVQCRSALIRHHGGFECLSGQADA